MSNSAVRFRRRLAVACVQVFSFVLLSAQLPMPASANSSSLVATWSRVGADGSTLANSLSTSGPNLLAQINSSYGSVTTDSGPLSDIETLSATICTNPDVMMISIGLKSKSFQEISDDPRDPANFYEDMFFLVFGDSQSERSVAAKLTTLTGIAVQYDSDCSSGN